MQKCIASMLLIAAFLFNINNIKAEEKEEFKTLKGNVTLVVLSCDKYSELWGPHFHHLFKFWPELKSNGVPVLLQSNEKDFSYPNVITVKVGADKDWSSSALKILEHVKTKYVMIMLEDYIVYKPVNQKRLLEIVNFLEKENAAYAEISPDERMFINGYEKNKKNVEGINNIVQRSFDGSFRVSLQACVWNVENFKSLIKPGENPWQFEQKGNERSKGLKEPFYILTGDYVVEFLNAAHRGKYEHEVVNYINDTGYEFKPKNMPVRITPVDPNYDHVRNKRHYVPVIPNEFIEKKKKNWRYKVKKGYYRMVKYLFG